jgi:NAD(P)-dependent dehydrogenase (short-subunit alcohol dehydrogenase family)
MLVNHPRASDPDRLHDAVSEATVLVTGASFGIGAATARKLASAGATVLLAARSADKLDELKATIAADGGNAVSYPADVSDEAAVAELAKRIRAEHGAPDIVVNNAGKSIRRSLHEQYERPHDFDRTIGVNYLGPIRLLLELVPEMRRRGSGHIVNVSSVGVRTPPGPRWGAYQASKGAFDMWLRSVAPELHADGVDVTSIYFGLINTRMMEPTKSLRNAPGLSAEQAADIVAKAITDRPRTIAPWWLWPAEVATVVLRAPVERATQVWWRRRAKHSD